MSDKAAALKYDKTSGGAPKVIASGKGNIAQMIVQKAKEFDIPIFANEALVNSLINLEIDHEIPSELYSAVVDVFVWLMKNEKKFNKH
ncbi:MAG: flagellar biosynthesis protein FlhB [Sulfurimonas sp. RIFOXYD12_FULL_33_39]|uniref:EscU/YscU/HrcU family type III secretion system export apparatus switch protein n=1 Tax=unclassified Sulfurimonas TaxID=2623549 RepID=UPI0008D29EF2|nr:MULTISPECIES: EscU/YscU/HrcU family type III secretion system export apparatus switch protein [unclassified Sulfurimonas]OHE01460.1 MAG: flagellar biosynthesis protein FlhB [Sulfurimonas sp. RIFCSPLOWO2_12_FULL_34_6]OHE09807.1 MAG: flagellar biosynthesis protein FlhB [Sulfurimonas sp. RIFOXYD12_FULL_33_39]OHE13685.1 MAG: flagellar biosynthesis protein FlhB [Sulfurimonas sp. RIFOXYD2_FULL_34_21]DAB28101.1 MAG TPA: flagellar biosynthesis protein FlhB [Sulfurimonas sp. UBA10385]